ncbi:MAG: hypothetical protein ACK4MX_05015 [Thermaurantiacus sp.]
MAAAAALALAGCGGSGETTRTVTTDSGEQVTVTTQANSRALEAQTVEIAKSLPAFAPLYPGATVVSTLDAQGASGGGQMVTLETRDPIDKVLEFYDTKIASAGGEAMMRSQTADSGTRAVRMADGSGGMVTVSSDGDTTTIGIVHGQQM